MPGLQRQSPPWGRNLPPSSRPQIWLFPNQAQRSPNLSSFLVLTPRSFSPSSSLSSLASSFPTYHPLSFTAPRLLLQSGARVKSSPQPSEHYRKGSKPARPPSQPCPKFRHLSPPSPRGLVKKRSERACHQDFSKDRFLGEREIVLEKRVDVAPLLGSAMWGVGKLLENIFIISFYLWPK